MASSFQETKRELFELMQRMRYNKFMPPTPDGITPAEARTVIAIDKLRRSDGVMRPSRVAEFTHTTPSALSQTFKTLEEKGLIERHRAGGDCRGVTVSLTAEGERFAAEGLRLHDAHMNQVMAYVGEEDMEHLVRIMRKVFEFHEQLATASDEVPEPDADREGGAPCA